MVTGATTAWAAGKNCALPRHRLRRYHRPTGHGVGCNHPGLPMVVRHARSSSRADSSSCSEMVVLTREAGKNGAMRQRIEDAGIKCLEMPLVESKAGPDKYVS